jgi:hypothetical protein
VTEAFAVTVLNSVHERGSSDGAAAGSTRLAQTTAIGPPEDTTTVTPEQDEGWDEFDHLGVVARVEAAGVEAADVRGFQQVFEEATARWYAGEHDQEYAESWPTFVDRIAAALDRSLAGAGVTVVVTSGGPIGVVCAGLVAPGAAPRDLPAYWTRFNTVTVNAGITRVLEGSTGRRLLSFNEHSHLPRDFVTYR